jgi:hypothetical protein
MFQKHNASPQNNQQNGNNATNEHGGSKTKTYRDNFPSFGGMERMRNEKG